MGKKVRSIRLSADEENKLNKLAVLDQLGGSIEVKNYTTIITEAINFYYTAKIDENADNLYLTKMSTYISDSIKSNLGEMAKSINMSRLTVEVTKELIKVLMLTYELPSEPEAVKKLVQKQSAYEEFIVNSIVKGMEEND